MINEVFASEETIALAKKKACEMLGAEEGNVGFEVIQNPAKKVLGMFGGKMAQVRAFLKQTPARRAKDYLKEMFYYMGMQSLNVTVETESAEVCDLKITGDDVKYIVGRHGETLDALQYISGLVANNKNSDGPFCRVRLEAGNYRENRKKVLEALARSVASKAIKSNKKVELEPMRSYERKIIHSTISEIFGVRSWSEGEGANRHIVAAPEAQNADDEFTEKDYVI